MQDFVHQQYDSPNKIWVASGKLNPHALNPYTPYTCNSANGNYTLCLWPQTLHSCSLHDALIIGLIFTAVG